MINKHAPQPTARMPLVEVMPPGPAGSQFLPYFSMLEGTSEVKPVMGNVTEVTAFRVLCKTLCGTDGFWASVRPNVVSLLIKSVIRSHPTVLWIAQ